MKQVFRRISWARGAALIGSALLILACCSTRPTLGQTVSPASPPGSQPGPPQPEYHPSLGDLMTMAVQPRHLKLGIAGRQKNWAYARYELSELRNAFGRIARTIPVYRNVELSGLFTALTDEPLTELGQATDAGDSARFKAAYAKLTSACNACHLSQDHPMVVIRVPDAAAFPDQDFRVH
jgi:hypothetical protein